MRLSTLIFHFSDYSFFLSILIVCSYTIINTFNSLYKYNVNLSSSYSILVRNIPLHYIFLMWVVYTTIIWLLYNNYSLFICYSHILITEFQYTIGFFILTILLIIYLNISQFLLQSFKYFTEYIITLVLISVWLIGIFAITNFLTFIFFFELLSLSILLCLSIFINYNNFSFYPTIVTNKFINLNLFIYSFIYLFWVSFLSIINLFILLIYMFKLTSTLDLTLLEILILFNFQLINLDSFSKLFIIWNIYIFSFFLKLGLIPFFLWKPNFFKSIPLNYLYIYIGYFFFFLFFFFLNMIYYNLYIFLIYFSTFNSILLFIGLFILIVSLININNIKIFIAFSSILNSFLLFISLISI